MHRLGAHQRRRRGERARQVQAKEADITVYGPGQHAHHHRHRNEHPPHDAASSRRSTSASRGDQICIEPIHYASAQRRREAHQRDLRREGGGSAPRAGGQGRRRPRRAERRAGGGDLHVAKIVADDRTNSLIIVATERAYLRMLELIKRIDVPQTGEGEIHVLPLQHADATELTKTLNDIITGAGARRRGAAPAAAAAAAAPAPRRAAQRASSRAA